LRKIIQERAAFCDQDRSETAQSASQGEGLALRDAFAALPPDQRLAAHLHFVEGLTLREIAEVQNVAIGTAKSRIFHARRKLRAALT
jgi:RNA polymerase sigma-70 factor (ECF subfamily)